MSQHHPFDDRYWNLAQACAWVEYRERQLVNDLESAERSDYMALGFYPKPQAGRQRHAGIADLRRALVDGRIVSSGYRRDTPEHLEVIPAAEWADLVIRPPFVSFLGQPDYQPWTAVRLASADMKRMWRSVNEVTGRSRYDWAAIREMYDELRIQNSEMSQNELILEVQGAFEGRFNKEPVNRHAKVTPLGGL